MAITIRVNGVEYPNWQNAKLVKRLGSLSGILEVNNVGDFFDLNIKMGDDLVASIADEVMLTGVVEEMDVDSFQENTYVEIVSRDKTGDIIDSSFDNPINEWKTQTVGNVIKNLCSPFSVEVVIDKSITSQTSKIIPLYKAEEGRMVVDMILELCRDYQIIPISIGDGKLTLIGSDYFQKESERISTNGNAFRTRFIGSDINRFSSYKVKGQGVGSDNKQLADWTEPSGSFTDSVVARTRPLVLFSDTATDNSKCLERAKWEARIRAGMSRMVFYELSSWTKVSGGVWKIGELVPVKDEVNGIDDTLLIDAIEYENGEEGELSRIYCVDKSTYDLSTQAIGIKSEYDN
jgi:prophage tail gpP-like protein